MDKTPHTAADDHLGLPEQNGAIAAIIPVAYR